MQVVAGSARFGGPAAAATLATAGLPLQEARAQPPWHALCEYDRFLVHGLSQSPALNGRVGLAASDGHTDDEDDGGTKTTAVAADGRLGVVMEERVPGEFGATGRKGVRVRRANLVPSAQPTQPVLLATTEGGGAEVLVLHSSSVHGARGQRVRDENGEEGVRLRPDWGSTVRASKLSLLPGAA